jgi:transcriptional regulator with XRE-family HTH domain
MFTIGDRIRKLLKARGKTIKELADYLGITTTAIYYLLNGATALSFERALQICQFLGISLEELAEEDKILARNPGGKPLIDLIREEVDRVIEERLKLEGEARKEKK